MPLNADVYDVNLTNNTIDVKPWGMNSAYDLFNNAYDSGQFDNSDYMLSDDSPMDTPGADGGTGYGAAYDDFGTTSSFTPPTGSHEVFTPLLSGRNPTGLSNTRYFNFSLAAWIFRTGINGSGQIAFNDSPLNEHNENPNENFRGYLRDKFIIFNPTLRTSFFNYTNFKNDLVSALIGTQNFEFLVRLIAALNTTPTAVNFTYTVPSIFGFDTGFVISIPFNDILHGSGDWYSFATVINLFRSMLSFSYYTGVVFFIIRCVFIHN